MFEYRPAYGFGLWFGATIIDALTIHHGVISLLGFAIALVWALGWNGLTSEDPW